MSNLNESLSRAPGSFRNLQEFHNWRLRNNLGFRPTLRLRPPRPPNPQMMNFGGTNYPISMPQSDPNYAWVTNRDTLEGNWQPINRPITEQAVGPTTFGQIGQDQVFSPEHHGINIPGESNMSDDQLRQNLSNWNLPTEGNRGELFARNMRVKNHPTLLRNAADGRAPNEAEVADIVSPNAPMSLGEAGQLRELRSQAGYYENVPPVQMQQPMPGATMRTLGDLPRAGLNAGAASEGGALAGGAAAGEMGAMGGAAMMASRAVPILNMVLLGKMLMDGMTNSSKEAKAKQQELMYRT